MAQAPPHHHSAEPTIDDSGPAQPGRRAGALEVLVLQRTAALMESQQLLRTTLEQMDQGLVLLDSDQVVKLCNPRALELLNLPVDVLHEDAAFINIRAFQNARGDFALLPADIIQIISGHDARKFPLVYDWPRPDGRTLEVRRVQFPDGGSVNTFTDVTERRAAELAVRESERLYRLMAQRVEELAQIDELTGLFNRRYILQALQQVSARAQRISAPFSVAIIDLDFFKCINDRFGHPAGDEVLRSFATTANANLREIDTVGRYGGEEFMVVLPHAPREQATASMDRLRKVVANLDWPAVSDNLAVTFSAGVTEGRPNDTVDELLARADAALYRAKDAGRNRVMSD